MGRQKSDRDIKYVATGKQVALQNDSDLQT